MERHTLLKRPTAQTFALTCLAAFLLALPATTLWPGNGAEAGEQSNTASVEPTADVNSQISAVLLDLIEDNDLDCERFSRLFLGLEDEETLGSQQLARFLLGIEGGVEDIEEIDCDRIFRVLLGIEDEEEFDGERIVRFLLGIDESDEIDREQIVRLLQTGGASVD